MHLCHPSGTNGIEVAAGRGGLPTVHLKSAAGATVEVSTGSLTACHIVMQLA